MKHILKNSNSKGAKELIKLKKSGGCYADVSDDKSKGIFTKTILLTSLIEEQNGMCAYRMRSIDIDSATIEHIIGQNYKDENIDGKEYDIEYTNLLAVCEGRYCKDTLHCDKSRANHQRNRPLYTNPLKQIIDNIKYSNTGKIYYKEYKEKDDISKLYDHTKTSTDESIQYDIQVVLNLNCKNIKDNRKAIVNALKRHTNNFSNKDKIKRAYDKITAKSTLNIADYIELYFLKKYI
jgi:hypothetical protein